MFLLLAIATVNEVPPVPPAPVVAVVATPDPVTRPITVGGVTVALPGHYDCSGTTNEDAGCVRVPQVDPGPNVGSDVPELMAGAGDVAYRERLVGELCAVKPWYCEAP